MRPVEVLEALQGGELGGGGPGEKPAVGFVVLVAGFAGSAAAPGTSDPVVGFAPVAGFGSSDPAVRWVAGFAGGA